MRESVLLVLVFVLAPSGIGYARPQPVAGPGGAPVPGGLIAHYTFRGNAYDVSGNGHDGVIEGPVFTTDRQGRPTAALSFTGGDDRVVLPNEGAFDLEVFTIAVILKLEPANHPQRRTILSKGPRFFGNYTIAVLPDDHQYFPRHFEYVYDATVPRSERQNFSVIGEALPPDAFVHVAIVKESDRVHVYMDGRLIRTRSGSPRPALTNGPVVIGGGLYGPFNGVIDDVRIYGRPLSAEEVALLATYQEPDQECDPARGSPRLHWQAVAGAASYEVVLDADGVTRAITRPGAGAVTLADFGVDWSAASSYRMRVRAVAEDGLPGAWSGWRSLSDGLESRQPACQAGPERQEFTTEMGYDDLGRLEWIDHPTTAGRRQQYEYVTGGGPASVRYGGSLIAGSGSYSESGMLESYVLQPATPFTGGSVSRSFDKLGRARVTQARLGSATHHRSEVVYRTNGQIDRVSRTFAFGSTDQIFVHGSQHGELRSMQVTGPNASGTLTYDYDVDGNLTAGSGLSTGRFNVPALVPQSFNAFNHNEAHQYDDAGRVVRADGLVLSYNTFDQLSRVADAASGAVRAAFLYDGNGRLARADFPDEAVFSARSVDGELTSQVRYRPEAGCWKPAVETDFVSFDQGVLLASHREGPADRRVYFHRDYRGDAELIFDQASSYALSEVAYSPYGHQMMAVPDVPQATGFGGYEVQDQLPYLYAHARYYGAATARFLTPDPARDLSRTNPFALNLYQFGRGSPMKYGDPTGLTSFLFGSTESSAFGERMIETMQMLGDRTYVYDHPDKGDPHNFKFGSTWKRLGSGIDCSTSTALAFLEATGGIINSQRMTDRLFDDLYTSWQILDKADDWRKGAVGALVRYGLAQSVPSIQEARRGDIVQGWSSKKSGHSFIITGLVRDAAGTVTGFHMISANTTTGNPDAPAIQIEYRDIGAYPELYIGRFFDTVP